VGGGSAEKRIERCGRKSQCRRVDSVLDVPDSVSDAPPDVDFRSKTTMRKRRSRHRAEVSCVQILDTLGDGESAMNAGPGSSGRRRRCISYIPLLSPAAGPGKTTSGKDFLDVARVGTWATIMMALLLRPFGILHAELDRPRPPTSR